MLADSHGHLFVTTDKSSVDVLSSDGASLTAIPVPASIAMALSPDGSTLYVAGQAGISAIDTTSLTVTRVYPLVPCANAMSLAVVGASLWFAGADCGFDSSAIGTLALDTGTVTTIPQSDAQVVLSVAGDDTTLLTYAGDELLTRWAVSGTTATAVAQITILANSVAVDPVSGDVLVADGASAAVMRFRMSDLTSDGSYPSEPHSSGLATSPALGGLVAIAGGGSPAALVPQPPDLDVYRGGVVARTQTYGHETSHLPAWTPDGSRLYLLLVDPSGPPTASTCSSEPAPRHRRRRSRLPRPSRAHTPCRSRGCCPSPASPASGCWSR